MDKETLRKELHKLIDLLENEKILKQYYDALKRLDVSESEREAARERLKEIAKTAWVGDVTTPPKYD